MLTALTELSLLNEENCYMFENKVIVTVFIIVQTVVKAFSVLSYNFSKI